MRNKSVRSWQSTVPPPHWPGSDTSWGPDRRRGAGWGAACDAPMLRLSPTQDADSPGWAPCTAWPEGDEGRFTSGNYYSNYKLYFIGSVEMWSWLNWLKNRHIHSITFIKLRFPTTGSFLVIIRSVLNLPPPTAKRNKGSSLDLQMQTM